MWKLINIDLSFLNSFRKVAFVSIVCLIGFFGYLYKDSLIKPTNKVLPEIFEAVMLSDPDVLSMGIWKLEGDYWNCRLGSSLSDLDFCNQTGSFYNDNFVKTFQMKLEREDIIVVEVNPERATFEKYWIGSYQTVFGTNREHWGPSLYVVYLQIGDSSDTRVVTYSLDKDIDISMRKFINHFKEDIINF